MRDGAGAAGAPRALLTVAAVAVGFAATDTYVVVLALPDMMASVGLNVDQLQRAAPIVSGFLLGYVAMLPLIGKVADLRGRVPVLVGSLVVFSVGSLVTASSYDLVSMVLGRLVQGVGAGGLVPATLALVADIWPADRRGVPLGVVGAVQELGAVLGPLYGALVLSFAGWHLIFWLNLVGGVVLAAVLVFLGYRRGQPGWRPLRHPGTSAAVAAGLAVLAFAALALTMSPPAGLASGVTTGLAFVPVSGGSRWLTPMALACYLLAAAGAGWLLWLRRRRANRPAPVGPPQAPQRVTADVTGALLLAGVLGGVVVAFATSDPAVHVFSPVGPWALAVSGCALLGFSWRQARAASPLVPRQALRSRPAWGSIVVSFFAGAGLIAALVDIPVFARVTVYPDSQLDAALVLLRFLVAVPVGALAGGFLTRRLPPALLACLGMLMAAGGFWWMSHWGMTALSNPLATVPLVICGLGFGLAIAPVNAAMLAATRAGVHGLASSFLVVARMVGMLIGISALTAIGLRRFYAASASAPSVREVCHSPVVCNAYLDVLKRAGVVQMHAVFEGAAVSVLVAAVVAVVVFARAGAGRRPDGLGVR